MLRPYRTGLASTRRACGSIALGLAGVMLAPSLGLAAGGGSSGMPQLEFSHPLVKAQVVWGAIIFAVLYLLLKRWALPLVETVLSEREQRISGDLEAAQAAKQRADVAVRELREATAKARAEAQSAINAATEKAKAGAAAQAAELNARLDAQLGAAEARINAARGAAMGALNQAARETAAEVIQRLTGTPADPAALDRAVAGALAARGAG